MEQLEQTMQVQSLPRIGEKAPDFTAKTTHGELSFSAYKGKWVVLFSHPADFTPVCTSEFVAFQEVYDRLLGINTELIGLSIDSVSSHIAWVINIEENFNTTIDFPIIADLDQQVATKIMIMPESDGTETSRAVFVIDDKQTIRALISIYPLSTGRNMEELFALSKHFEQPIIIRFPRRRTGSQEDKVIVKPPQTKEEANERMNNSEMNVSIGIFLKKN